MFPGLDLYYADPAQPLTTAGEELDYLDHDLSHLSVRRMKSGHKQSATRRRRENAIIPLVDENKC